MDEGVLYTGVAIGGDLGPLYLRLPYLTIWRGKYSIVLLIECTRLLR